MGLLKECVIVESGVLIIFEKFSTNYSLRIMQRSSNQTTSFPKLCSTKSRTYLVTRIFEDQLDGRTVFWPCFKKKETKIISLPLSL